MIYNNPVFIQIEGTKHLTLYDASAIRIPLYLLNRSFLDASYLQARKKNIARFTRS